MARSKKACLIFFDEIDAIGEFFLKRKLFDPGSLWKNLFFTKSSPKLKIFLKN